MFPANEQLVEGEKRFCPICQTMVDRKMRGCYSKHVKSDTSSVDFYRKFITWYSSVISQCYNYVYLRCRRNNRNGLAANLMDEYRKEEENEVPVIQGVPVADEAENEREEEDYPHLV